MFELPRNIKGEYNVHKKLPDNCKIDFFFNAKHSSLYVLISGNALADVKVAASMAPEWMR